jgi:hypothetical protein
MVGTFTVRITESGAEIHDLRYRYTWSAWLCGRLVGKGHALGPDEAVAQAQELVDADDVDRMDIDYRGRGRFLTQA